MLCPDRARAREDVGRVEVGRAVEAGRANDDGAATDADGLAEFRGTEHRRRLHLGLQGPRTCAACEHVSRAGVGAAVVVVGGSDNEGVAVDRHRLAEALPAASRQVGRIELGLFVPAGTVPEVNVDDARRRIDQFGTDHQCVATDRRDVAGVPGIHGRRGEQVGLAGPADDAVHRQRVQHEVGQIQVGNVDAVDRQGRRSVGRGNTKARQTVHDQRLGAAEVEGVACNQHLARARDRGTRRVGAGGHAVACDAQRVAIRAVGAAVEIDEHAARGHALLEIGKRQVVASLALQREHVVSVVDTALDVEGVVARAGIDGDVIGVGAREHLHCVVAAAERELDVLRTAAVDVERRLRLPGGVQHHAGVRGGCRVVAKDRGELRDPAGVGAGGRQRGRENLREGPVDEGQRLVDCRRRVEVGNRVMATLAVEEHRNAARVVGARCACDVDLEAVERVAARQHGLADLQQVVALAAVDREGRRLAHRRLFALRTLQLHRVVALAGIDHEGLEAADVDVAGAHAGARHRRRVELPRRAIGQRRRRRVDRICHRPGPVGGGATVGEDDLVADLGALAVEVQRAEDVVERAAGVVARRGADDDGAGARAGSNAQRRGGGE